MTECEQHPGEEKWVPVPGASGYEVSNRGGFRSVDRMTRDGRKLEGRVLKPRTTATIAYPIVGYTGDDGRKLTRTVHTAELEAFAGPCPPGMEACHADDVPAHNCRENLRWDYPEGNLADRMRNKPPRICVRCELRPVTNGGLRCHECVVEVGKDAAPLLEGGVPLGKACKMLGYPSPEGLHTLARRYGGYGQRPAGPPLPAALSPPPQRQRSVTTLLAALRDRLRRRHRA